eukprot:Gb_23862 [translate_table: standard]
MRGWLLLSEMPASCVLQTHHAGMGLMLFLPSQILPFLVNRSHRMLASLHFCKGNRNGNGNGGRFVSPTKFNFSCITASSQSSTSTFQYDAILNYGPSLSKGQILEDNEPNQDEYLDKRIFARVFDIAALRVPAEDCHGLQTKLKGHLLNWPRVKNVVRVPGDDIDEQMKELFWDQTGKQEDFLSMRESESGGNEDISDPLQERVKIIKKFNSRGYIHFRNLAKISRPRKKKKEERDSGEPRRKSKKDGFVVVEVVEDDGDIDADEDMSGLLGEDYRAKTWKGPTRLLLLDERHVKKPVSELPQAVQAVLRGADDQSRKIKPDIVQCKLTLFYDYWQMDEVLEELLPKGMVIPSAFEVVGHIAHLNLRTEHLPYRRLIAQVVLDKNRPKIKTVVNKTDAIQNDYRTMQLEVLAGNHSLVTTVIENGIRFHVDLATVYWNSRLSTERQRVLNTFTRSDIICDVFSGVGPLAIAAAKKVNRVYSNDLNPFAVKYQLMNIACHKLQGKVEVFNLDGRRFIKEIFGRDMPSLVSQVVMNLPKDAAEYLDAFRGAFREQHQDIHVLMPTIHVYGFSKAPIPESEFLERIATALGEIPKEVDMHRVRLVAPGKWMLCAMFPLPKRVAFADLA